MAALFRQRDGTMWRKFINIQQWLAKNRLLLWWVVFVPVVLLIVLCNTRYLVPEVTDIANPLIPLQFKIFNSVLLIVLARIVLVALGVVIMMICLLFPVLRVGREGIQWTKELEDELSEVSGEIAGEEIRELIEQESWRWSLIQGWLKRMQNAGEQDQDMAFPVRDLLNTLWEAFRGHRLSLTLSRANQRWSVLHPLMPRLIGEESDRAWNPETTLRMEIRVSSDFMLLLNLYAAEPGGFSRVDEQFLLALSELFLQEMIPEGPVPEKCFEGFELISLTPESETV